jgi:hypothetical protein
MTFKRTLKVAVVATLEETVEAMVDQVARAACDVANSTDDDYAHICVTEVAQEKSLGLVAD